MISAGRVLLMPKGDYDPTATYEMLDIVSYNGSSYIAKSTTTGNLPTNTTYWQLSAYGGQAANLAGNFAPLETTEYATRAYVADDIFVDKDSQLVIATTTINIGDEIEIGSNCDVTTMAELLDAIENRYDALDQRNRKLVGINPITIQTDLHLLAPGEYFKKLTNFYVTNAPTGINQVPTAIFRLTVESGLDESGSSLLLTLRATDGKVYTQSYDGTSWSAWVEVSSKAYVDNGLALKANIADLGTAAYKDSTNAVTSGSTDLVESGAVYSEIQSLDNSKAAKTQITNPNLLDNPWFTVNQRGLSTYSNVNYSYTVDRWLGSSGFDLYVDSDGVSVSSGNKSIFHRFEDSLYNFLVGKTVTLSVLKSNGSIVSISGVVKSNGNSLAYESDNDVSIYLAKDQYANFVQIVFKNTTVKLRAVKLELGTVSTLAHDTAPNYQQEIAKCQRYYQRWTFAQYLTVAFIQASTNWTTLFFPSQKMRIKPTLILTGAWADVSTDTVSVHSSNLIVEESIGGYMIGGARDTNGSNASGYAYALDAGGLVVELSADL